MIDISKLTDADRGRRVVCEIQGVCPPCVGRIKDWDFEQRSDAMIYVDLDKNKAYKAGWEPSHVTFADDTPQPAPAQTYRGQILDEARRLTEGDRNKTYGDPYPVLQCTAGMANEYFQRRFPGLCFDAHDISLILGLHKIARIDANRLHYDNYVDGPNYVGAIAGELACGPNAPCAELPEVKRQRALEEGGQ